MTATEIEIKLQLKDLPEFKEFVASLQRRLDMLEIQLDTVRLERDEWERQYDQLLESVRQANLIP